MGQSMPVIVLNGKTVFKLVDTYGVFMEVIHEVLRRRGMAFDVCSFIDCALASKNFKPKTIKAKLLEGCLPQYRDEIAEQIDTYLETKGGTHGNCKNLEVQLHLWLR